MDHSARMVTRRTLGPCSIHRKYITNPVDTKSLGFYTGTIAPTDVWSRRDTGSSWKKKVIIDFFQLPSYRTFLCPPRFCLD
jgi:hypothetical protein